MAKEAGPYIVEDRRMISRVKGDRIRLTHIVEPGERVKGCCTCFSAPRLFPMLSYWLCCVDYPKRTVNKLNSSKYVYIRENSIEFNTPEIRAANGLWFGSACCRLSVKDKVTVIYFDDMHFSRVTDVTRPCNEFKTFCCGGDGEKVQIDSRFCCGLCKRAQCAYVCIPSCFSEQCCPCLVASHEIYVEDAQTAVEAINMARDDAEERIEKITAGVKYRQM